MKLFFSKLYEPFTGMIFGSITWQLVGDAAFTLIIAFLSAIVAYFGKRLCVRYFENNDNVKPER